MAIKSEISFHKDTKPQFRNLCLCHVQNGDSSTENSEKDKETKPTLESPDKIEERLKERKAEEEKRRQLLHDKLKDLSKQSDKPAADGNPTADAKDKEKKRGRKPKEADAYDKTNSLTNSGQFLL